MRSRSYDKEFKLNAVTLYKTYKGSQAAFCREIGIPATTFIGWLQEYDKEGQKSFPGSGNIKASNEELYNLRKELEDVKMQRDILKKAVAIFSKQQP